MKAILEYLVSAWSALDAEGRSVVAKWFPWILAAGLAAALAYGWMCPCAKAQEVGQSSYRWEKFSGAGQWGLYRGNTQVGFYDARTKQLSGVNGFVIEGPPIPLPDVAFGVESSQISRTPRYTFQGREIDRQTAVQLAGDGKLPEDREHLRFTFCSDNAQDRQRVAQDWESNPSLAPFKATTVRQIYDTTRPESKAMLACGFDTSPGSRCYLQLPTGKEVGYWTSYPGAEVLALALRKADPNYKPGGGGGIPGVPGGLPILPLAVVGGITAAILIFGKRG